MIAIVCVNQKFIVAIMETFSSIECFVRSAEVGSFAEAARRLSLTPAAVGKSVAKLEARLGVRLFQRSTRSLTLTEAGELRIEGNELRITKLSLDEGQVIVEGEIVALEYAEAPVERGSLFSRMFR